MYLNRKLFNVALFLSLFGSDLAHATVEQDALDLIANFADRMCSKIPLSGDAKNVELTGQAQAELSSLIKYLADIGIEGAISYENSSFQGVVREDLVEALSNSTDCRLQIWNDLKVRMVGANEEVAGANIDSGLEALEENLVSKEEEMFRFNRNCSSDAKSRNTIIKCGNSNFCEISFNNGSSSERMVFAIREIDVSLDKINYGVDFNCQLGKCLRFENSKNEEYSKDFYSIDYEFSNFSCAKFLVEFLN